MVYQTVEKDLAASLTGAIADQRRKGCDPTVSAAPIALEPAFRPLRPDALFRRGKQRQKQRRPPRPLTVVRRVQFARSYTRQEERCRAALLELVSLQDPLSIELVSEDREVTMQFACSRRDADLVERAFHRAPGTTLVPADAQLQAPGVFADLCPDASVGASLSNLSSASLLDNLLESMQALAGRLVLQLLLQPTQFDWGNQLVALIEMEMRARVLLGTGRAESIPKHVMQKASSPLFAIAVRLGAQTQEQLEVLCAALNALRVGNRPLRRLDRAHFASVLGHDGAAELIARRRAHRAGFLLSLEECLGLGVLPERGPRRVRKPEEIDPTDAVSLGIVDGKEVLLTTSARLRHLSLSGSPGAGKTHALRHLAAQDVTAGRGVTIIEPHGDLVGRDLFIPSGRVDDVVWLSLVEDTVIPAFNLLHLPDGADPGRVADDLVDCMRAQSSTWGVRMEAIFRPSFYALLCVPDACLGDLPQLLDPHDVSLRSRALEYVDHDDVRRFLEDFRSVERVALAPILNRLQRFMLNKYLGRFFRQREHRIDLQEVIAEGKVLLVNIPSGQLGVDGSNLVGSIIITLLYHAALARGRLSPEQRTFFGVYIDELARFGSASTPALISEARKFGMGMTVAFQNFEQLPRETAAALGMTDSLLAFRCGLETSQRLVKVFHGLELRDLQQRDVGQAWAMLSGEQYDLRIPPPKDERNYLQEAIQRSLARDYLTANATTAVKKPEDGKPLFEEL